MGPETRKFENCRYEVPSPKVLQLGRQGEALSGDIQSSV